MRIFFATRNKGKLHEIRTLLTGSDIEIIGVDEIEEIPDVVEDGKTLEENALKKARSIFQAVHNWTAAEDTGLFIDTLNGEPGIIQRVGPGRAVTMRRIRLSA